MSRKRKGVLIVDIARYIFPGAMSIAWPGVCLQTIHKDTVEVSYVVVA